jgi:dihydroorotate dehydrogenase
MYKVLIRPFFFLFDPEKVHYLVVFLVKLTGYLPGIGNFLQNWLNLTSPRLQTTVAGLHFRNRVGLAAGFDKNADFVKDFSRFGFSFYEIGTVTPLPQPGNPLPRLFRLPKDKALVNRMGFNNKGVEYAAEQLKKRTGDLIIGGNIGKNTLTPNEQAAEDYALCFNTLYDRVDYLTVNVSCPNIAGLEKLQDQDSLREILDRIMLERNKRTIRKPVLLKISPDLSLQHLDEIISLAEQTGVDGIIATNTSTRRSDLITDASHVQAIGNGGLSGAPLKNRVVETVSYICKQSEGRIPVIAVGGIITPQDAVDMIRAGASLVQIYTGFIYAGPMLVKRINKAIDQYLKQSFH